jgi:hypothetical protein
MQWVWLHPNSLTSEPFILFVPLKKKTGIGLLSDSAVEKSRGAPVRASAGLRISDLGLLQRRLEVRPDLSLKLETEQARRSKPSFARNNITGRSDFGAGSLTA